MKNETKYKPAVKPKLSQMDSERRQRLEAKRLEIMAIMQADDRYREYIVGVGINLPRGDGINVYLKPGVPLPKNLEFHVGAKVFYLPSRNNGSFRA